MLALITYEIKEIRNFLTELAAHRDEIEIYGLNYFVRKFSTESVERNLERFQSNLLRAVQEARFIDKGYYETLNDTIKETKLQGAISNIRVQVDIAKKQNPIGPIVKSFRFMLTLMPFSTKISLLTKRSGGTILFADEQVSINNTLASLYRIESIFESVNNMKYSRESNDDDIFKPSNVNLLFIADKIELAISEITNSSISKNERDKLIEYLENAKSELSKDKPAWRNVIGALTITATLLGGIAVAPTAYDNIHEAIIHILGTSIDHRNLRFPALPAPEKLDDDTDSRSINI